MFYSLATIKKYLSTRISIAILPFFIREDLYNNTQIPVRDLPDHFTGISRCHCVGRNIFQDHAPGSDHGVFSGQILTDECG